MSGVAAMDTSQRIKKNTKRKKASLQATSAQKRSKLADMVFFDGHRHPAAVLHELRSDISLDKYHFEQEENGPNQIRFRCSVIIDENGAQPITAVGLGRSKQLAKNMPAQVELLPQSSMNRTVKDRLL